MMKYISFAGIMAIASTLLCNVVMGVEVEIMLEAEFADRIQAPVAVGVPDDVKKVNGPIPGQPSNGKFIWAPGAPVAGGGGSGYAEFIIDIPKDGTYAIWGQVVAWDGNSDSFWVTWQPADPDENPQATQNTQYRWAVAQGNDWHWDRVNAWLNAGTVEREWELEKGETRLRIWSREDATMLDCLYITDDIVRGQANARVPTDEDREAQIQSSRDRAVDAAGKLSTTWGRIRSEYRD